MEEKDLGYPATWLTLAVVVVLNGVIAVSLWLTVPAMGRFSSILVYSQCVGLAITLAAMAIGRLATRLGLRDFAKRTPVLFLALMLVPAAPIGYLAGNILAQMLLGHPATSSRGPMTGAAWLATVLATATAGYLLWSRQRIAGEARAREQAQRLAAEAELRLLRAQLEPHMLFNTLANLRELVVVDAVAAQRMIDNLIVFLRSTLAATRSERTTLAEEFAQLGAYLQLMAVRMGPRLDWHAELPEALRAAPLPPMILQPLVENAIRHGLEPQVGGGSIVLRAQAEEGALCIRVEDSGVGQVAAAPEAGPAAARDPASGYGLAHVRERLAAVYGGAASLRLEPRQPHGMSAIVTLPLGWPITLPTGVVEARA